MARGRGFSTPRGSYRGSSSRGSSSWNSSGGGRGNYTPLGGGGRYSSSFPTPTDSRNSFNSRGKYGSSRPPHPDEYKYRSDSSYMGGRDSRRSPDRKRLRMEAPSSRHDSSYGSSYGSSSRHEPPSSYSERRYSGERHASTPYPRGREDFRRPSGPPNRGSYRGRISSRGTRAARARDRPGRRRLVDSSYGIRRRALPRSSDYSRRLKITRMKSAIARQAAKRRLVDKEESGDEKIKEKKEDENEESKDEKSPKKEGEKDKKDHEDRPKKKKMFIKLHCPHCGMKAITFRRYEMHLNNKAHMIAMRKIALKQKFILAQMRQAQRNTQNELEKSSDDLAANTNFCPLCKLNYKQKKSVHQLSEAHKNMKKFLMPYCKICNINFKSPMIYESHICSIEHMKRKQRMENANSDASADENDLENFTTIDSVGDGDGEDGAETKKEEEEKKEPVNVGIEQIRKIEAQYCDLCKMYLPRGDDDEIPRILSRHCKQRVHMQRYVRYKERQELERRAEKLQRKENAEKEGSVKKEETNEESSKSAEGESKGESPSKNAEGEDDKMWADVDKDLGDLLAEAESGNKSSDEDEDDSHVNGERYDRFKLSEKNDDDKLMKAEEEGLLDIKNEAKTVDEK